MNKIASFLSLFCLGGAVSSFVTWLISLSPVKSLSIWLLFITLLLLICFTIFDDAAKSFLQITDDNLYYGGIVFSIVSILLGTTLVWICN